MERRTTIVVAFLIVGLLLLGIALLARSSVNAPTEASAVHNPLDAWATHLKVVDEALERHDKTTAIRAWHEAYVAAVASRRWEGLVDVGDATLRIADTGGLRRPYEAKARSAYLAALFRARAAGSPEGVLKVCARFTDLGDWEVSLQCAEIARTLVRKTSPRETIELNSAEYLGAAR